MTELWVFLQVEDVGALLQQMLLSLGACLVFERRFGAEGKELAGKWPVSVELRQAWEFLGYQCYL